MSRLCISHSHVSALTRTALLAGSLLGCLLPMGLARGASATTFRLIDGSNARWRLHVTAFDGLSNVVVFDEDIALLENSDGFFEGEPIGVINPAFRAVGFDIRMRPISFSTTIGAANIPVEIEIDEAVFAGGFPFDEEVILFVGDPSHTTAGLKPRRDELRGLLTADGTAVAFDFSNDACNEPFGSCPKALRAVSQTEIEFLGGTGISVSGVVGPIDGIEYTISMSPAWTRLGYVVPEPSTALLLASGIVALAVRRRQIGPRGTL